MEKIKLYIDEDLTDRIAVALRSRGYDVISAQAQLEFASKHGRVILTRNIKHFVALQREYYRHGLLHKGIVVFLLMLSSLITYDSSVAERSVYSITLGKPNTARLRR